MARRKSFKTLAAQLGDAEKAFSQEIGSEAPDYDKLSNIRSEIEKLKHEVAIALVSASEIPSEENDIKFLSAELDRAEKEYSREIGSSEPNYARVGEIRAKISKIKKELFQALESRSHEEGESSEDAAESPEIPAALLEALRDRKCLLFAGAGASIDAGLPTWAEMVNDLVDMATKAGTVDERHRKESLILLAKGEFGVLTEFFSQQLTKHDFAEYLRGQLSNLNRVSPTHQILADIPFRAAVTTNFDPFLESSFQNSRVVLPKTMDDFGAPGVLEVFSEEGKFPVIKIHGSYEEPSSIVLTHSDFRELLFEKTKYREFLDRLFTEWTVLFYGFGFRDLNVDMALQKCRAIYSSTARPHYALTAEPAAIWSNHMRRSYNVRIIGYENRNKAHSSAHLFLKKLASAVS